MKLFAPEYYRDFKCIADKCTHSCCIGWEIDVDKKAIKKYSKLNNEYAKEINASIEGNPPHFRLLDEERCSHLDKNGLCKIILNCGEEYLCDICREHPRFYNYTNYGKEVGIGISCPEACRLILSSDNFDKLTVISENKEKEEIIEFDATICRGKIFSVLKSKELSYKEKLTTIYSSFGVSPDIVSNEGWNECLSNLEYLNESHRELFSNYSFSLEAQNNLENVLAYLIYRHCTEAFDENEFIIDLGFCLFCERLLDSMIKNNKSYDIDTLAMILSEEIEYSTDNIQEIKNRIEEAI